MLSVLQCKSYFNDHKEFLLKNYQGFVLNLYRFILKVFKRWDFSKENHCDACIRYITHILCTHIKNTILLFIVFSFFSLE